MALPSFILAPDSNELEKCPVPGNNGASRLRRRQNVVPRLLCRGEGKGGGHNVPCPLGPMAYCLRGREEKQTLSVENRVENQAWEHMECLTEFVENES